MPVLERNGDASKCEEKELECSSGSVGTLDHTGNLNSSCLSKLTGNR